MSEEAPRHFKTVEEWRSWLNENHNIVDSLWVIIQKKASKQVGLRYEEAVLEAVAYGWIDGKMKRIDDDTFMQRFSPRRPDSIWSLSNKKRVQRLLEENKMTSAGMEKVEEAKKSGQWDKAYTSRAPVQLPEDLKQALEKNPKAKENFSEFPQSTRFIYIHWINEAKREKTRARRINTVVVRAERDLKPGIDLRVIKP
jgi:uncharacterized protein YdeI (YjbR/CyaY-like superfamily)